MKVSMIQSLTPFLSTLLPLQRSMDGQHDAHAAANARTPSTSPDLVVPSRRQRTASRPRVSPGSSSRSASMDIDREGATSVERLPQPEENRRSTRARPLRGPIRLIPPDEPIFDVKLPPLPETWWPTPRIRVNPNPPPEDRPQWSYDDSEQSEEDAHAAQDDGVIDDLWNRLIDVDSLEELAFLRRVEPDWLANLPPPTPMLRPAPPQQNPDVDPIIDLTMSDDEEAGERVPQTPPPLWTEAGRIREANIQRDERVRMVARIEQERRERDAFAAEAETVMRQAQMAEAEDEAGPSSRPLAPQGDVSMADEPTASTSPDAQAVETEHGTGEGEPTGGPQMDGGGEGQADEHRPAPLPPNNRDEPVVIDDSDDEAGPPLPRRRERARSILCEQMDQMTAQQESQNTPPQLPTPPKVKTSPPPQLFIPTPERRFAKPCLDALDAPNILDDNDEEEDEDGLIDDAHGDQVEAEVRRRMRRQSTIIGDEGDSRTPSPVPGPSIFDGCMADDDSGAGSSTASATVSPETSPDPPSTVTEDQQTLADGEAKTPTGAEISRVRDFVGLRQRGQP